MSNSNRLLMLAVICVSAGGGLFLIGPTGRGGLLIAAAAFVVGVLTLVGSLVLRRREPMPSADAGLPPLAPGPSRAGTIGAVAGTVLGAVALALTLFVAEGEARGHGIFHLLFGVVVLGLFVAVDRWWRPREGTTGASFRSPLLVVLWIALAGAFLESIGAAGYDELNAAHRIEWLTTVHNVVTPLGALALLTIPMALAALAATFVGHLRARRVAAS
jgi:hypothetical protein